MESVAWIFGGGLFAGRRGEGEGVGLEVWNFYREVFCGVCFGCREGGVGWGQVRIFGNFLWWLWGGPWVSRKGCPKASVGDFLARFQ